MRAAPILFVTGKGGAGKTTVACGAATALAARGDRVLLVEPYGQSGVATYFDGVELDRQPRRVAANLDAVRLHPRHLLEEYFRGLLRLPALARRLLSSSTFNAVTSAAPGVTEFLILDRLEGWSRGGDYDRLIVDGPATGHALQLLRAPFQLAGIAATGPLHRPLRRLTDTLRRPARTAVAFVSLCEEMSVAESVEARAVVAEQLHIAVPRPVLNRCARRRFTRDDMRAIEELPAAQPLVAAARLHVAAQRRTASFATVLKKAFAAPTLALPDIDGECEAAGTAEIGHALVRGWKL